MVEFLVCLALGAAIYIGAGIYAEHIGYWFMRGKQRAAQEKGHSDDQAR